LSRYVDFLKKVALFSSLSDDELEQVASCLQVERVPRNTMIVQQGDPGDSMYVILMGRIKVGLFSEGGREVILAHLEPGDFFGEMAIVAEQPRSASVVAVEDSSLLKLTRADFVRQVHRNPDIALNMMKLLAGRLAVADEKIGDLALVDVSGRVARFLARLARERGESGPDGTMIQNRPTHQEIANIVGTARETVSRAVSDMVREKRIRIEGKTLVILGGIEALEEFESA
jgi:CRP/FNR family transcriptional regulator, cyclic AMP receptor protein